MADGNAFVKFGVGQPVRRFEDQRFLTGAGRYVDDRTMPGLLHAVFLRSPHANARLRRVDATAARAASGVAGVFTGAEWRAAGLGPLPGRNFINHLDGRPVAPPPRFALVCDRVRHVGDCVAIVVAATRAQAEDALEQIVIDYEELPAVASPVEALAPGAPAIWAKSEWWEGARDEAALNTAFVWRIGDGDKTAAAIAAARHVVRTRLVNNRLVIHYIEPRGCIAWRDETGRMVFGGSLQNAPNFRELLCLQFGWKPEQLRVVAWYADGPLSYFFKGQATSLGNNSPLLWLDSDYAVLYVNQWQRQIPSAEAVAYFDGQTPVHVVRFGGLELARIYDMRNMVLPAFIDIGKESAADFGGQIRLAAYKIDQQTANPGDRFQTTFYLQSRAPMTRRRPRPPAAATTAS